jgi:mono/diheme cytochrome c family protein
MHTTHREQFCSQGVRFMTSIVQDSLRCGLAACLLMMSASQAIGQTPDGSFSDPTRFIPRDGEVLYRTSCQGCHMSAGEGAIGAGAYPALAKNSKLRARRYPVSVVVNGSKAMPPFGHFLDDEQVAAVVNYVRTHFGNDYKDSVSTADAKAVRP